MMTKQCKITIILDDDTNDALEARRNKREARVPTKRQVGSGLLTFAGACIWALATMDNSGG